MKKIFNYVNTSEEGDPGTCEHCGQRSVVLETVCWHGWGEITVCRQCYNRERIQGNID